MRLAALVSVMLAAVLSACATSSTELPPERGIGQKGSVDVIGHHCDGQGVDSLALHVEGPGEVVIRWSNKGVCGTPA